MEGIYYTFASEQTKQLFASEKNKFLIGCFGKSDRNHLLWAYYADGYSGACVELDIPSDSGIDKIFDIVEIEYVNKEHFNDAIKPSIESIKKVLTRKLLSWKNENELRVLTCKVTQPEERGANIKVGKVTSVTFGVNILENALCFLRNNTKQLLDSIDQVQWKIKEPTEAIQSCDNLQHAFDKIHGYKLWRADFSA